MADCEPSAHRFMDLMVPEYAYMFGFLQADGHLSQQSRQRGRLTVELNARDVHLLHRFQKLTPYNSSITKRSRSTNFAEVHTSATWTLCSLEARTRLNELGLPYGRKSKTIAPPSVEFSHRDYAIGMFLRQYAMDVTGCERNIKRNTRDGIYNVYYTMEAAQSLAAHLYYPGCLALDRKQKAADSLGAWGRPADMRAAHTRRRWNETEDRILLRLKSPKAAAEALGRTAQSCNLRLWRLRTGQVPMQNGR